ncbi:hypothetical protein ARMGADRAFT_462677 [Armillaria gallica]|uniref:Uncharacterized protein n=1 Tax=Armillaria gallica TaxID=47427 RepID=A0A2H3D8V3_ARMGA|nr:hypothetical protein ARMGADRAFT_462677 [Armillaria gallica]
MRGRQSNLSIVCEGEQQKMWGGRYRQGTSVERREGRLRDCKIRCVLEGTVMDQPGYRRTSNLKITRARLEQNVFLTLTLGFSFAAWISRPAHAASVRQEAR